VHRPGNETGECSELSASKKFVGASSTCFVFCFFCFESQRCSFNSTRAETHRLASDGLWSREEGVFAVGARMFLLQAVLI